jgi:hypothetical protein
VLAVHCGLREGELLGEDMLTFPQQ